jgi:hypothetical protein
VDLCYIILIQAPACGGPTKEFLYISTDNTAWLKCGLQFDSARLFEVRNLWTVKSSLKN